jgi:hypothetical protein
MTLDEFRALADARGGDLGSWPDHLRASATTLAKTSEAQEILAEAQRIDALIRPARPQPSEQRLGAATFAVAAKIGAERRDASGAADRGIALGLPWWAAAAASIAVGAAVGGWLGFEKPLHAWRGPEHQTVLTMILNDGPVDPGWVLQ